MRIAVWVIAVGLFAAATLGKVAAAEPVRFGGPTMGTTYHVRLAGEPSVDVARLQADIDALLAEVDRQMSTYRPDSELSRFNRAPAGAWFSVSAKVVEVVIAAQEISKKTSGALDVTVGPLVRLWQFGPKQPADKKAGTGDFQPPSDDAIATARWAVGHEKLDVRTEPPALRKDIDALEVDLSSIAPGYAVDRMAELLVDRGFKDFMVEIGGEVRTAGRRDDGRPWRVAIERPLADRREMQVAIPLMDAAISTAGDYRKFFEHAGRRYSHIMDPVTGRPVEHSLASVTVVADTCLEADAWDTPLLVMGLKRGYKSAEQNGIAALFIEHGANREAARATSAWRRRIGE